MLYKVTNVQFDFDEENAPSEESLMALKKFSMDGLWEADSLMEVVEMVTCLTGWCISYIDAVTIP